MIAPDMRTRLTFVGADREGQAAAVRVWKTLCIMHSRCPFGRGGRPFDWGVRQGQCAQAIDWDCTRLLMLC
jgi:hypothetical protein